MDATKTLNYRFHPQSEGDWLEKTLESLETNGFAILEDVFEADLCLSIENDLKDAHKLIHSKISKDILIERNEYPFIRLPMNYCPQVLELLDSDIVNQIIERYLSENAIVRNITGQFVSPNGQEDKKFEVYHWYHRNFRHLKNTPGICLDVLLSLQELTDRNGAVHVVPGSHIWTHEPGLDELEADNVVINLKAGDLLLNDGMLWHKEDFNRTDKDLPLLVSQFVLPVIKQHIDYPRALNRELISTLSEKQKNRLGFSSVVPSNLEEYYNVERTYKNSLPIDEFRKYNLK